MMYSDQLNFDTGTDLFPCSFRTFRTGDQQVTPIGVPENQIECSVLTRQFSCRLQAPNVPCCKGTQSQTHRAQKESVETIEFMPALCKTLHSQSYFSAPSLNLCTHISLKQLHYLLSKSLIVSAYTTLERTSFRLLPFTALSKIFFLCLKKKACFISPELGLVSTIKVYLYGGKKRSFLVIFADCRFILQIAMILLVRENKHAFVLLLSDLLLLQPMHLKLQLCCSYLFT